MKNAFFLVVGLAFLAGSFLLFLRNPASDKYQGLQLIQVNGEEIRVETASTPEERAQGLSGRKSLASGTGLLFVFPELSQPGFWMKDMNFAIDIIWLDANMEVIDIERNVTPGTFPQVFYPPLPVKYVLETNPGEIN